MAPPAVSEPIRSQRAETALTLMYSTSQDRDSASCIHSVMIQVVFELLNQYNIQGIELMNPIKAKSTFLTILGCKIKHGPICNPHTQTTSLTKCGGYSPHKPPLLF